jgi:hypothetical protein
MATTRNAPGSYTIRGTTTLDGQAVAVEYNVWKHESIQHCWLVETTFPGISTRVECHSDYGSKRQAVQISKRCAVVGYKRVPGLGICLN